MKIETTNDPARETTNNRGFGNRDRRPSDIFLQDPRKIVEGILTLAAAEHACLPVARIHSTLHEMKSREPLLAGLYFSLIGDVCYSEDVDKAIKDLAAWGSLKFVKKSAVVVAGFRRFRRHLSNLLTKQQFQAVRAASMCFYDRVAEEPRGEGIRPVPGDRSKGMAVS